MSLAARHVVVVGAGVTGLLTAVSCARVGDRVTLLDRGPVPNPASTSFDQHRALRALDPTDPEASEHGAALHRAWLELETLLGTPFYRRVGVVTAWPAGPAAAVASAGAAAGLPVDLVDPADLPHVRWPAGTVGVREYDAGVLLAERILHAATRWLRDRPRVRLRPGEQVTDVDPDRPAVLLAGGRRLDADLVVLAAGPWLPDLVAPPTVLYRQPMVYLRPPKDLAGWWATAPSAGGIGLDGVSWLLPSGAGALLKVSSDTVCQPVGSLTAADQRPFDPHALVRSVLPEASRYRLHSVKHCHYLVDAASGAARLARPAPAVWAAVSGGDGFRSAPLVAARIARPAGALAAPRP